MIEVKDLSVAFGERSVLRSVSFRVEDDDWLMIVGPNGAGKSTIVNALSKGVYYQGEIRVDGQDIAEMKPRALAHKIGVLRQSHSVGYGFLTEEVIRLGCYSHRTLFSAGEKDSEKFRGTAWGRRV